ncbi:3-phosphoshikimate 1-carboxyvinyltransferase [Streptomyces sp. AV19]|uniref:3-phosphoshikimate 1-carboxyvinyltransferase n=1 Tax=Streptomyces sp. AV19 TaxID=2793068 RepID=UPI0018FF0B2C|nr:3-phosphoshikimate 1-carboxyvinyltransferase [Streptomyces sp. AV19]MBH1938937.1 3-phosphoshikimate 1-carboxyvinyltransferase [Streptomyces sp. AV19]MDG4536819.1 3-phosphoshikimate 1-carboxyvinyltransferase [Streptomyces sp. AV19]
MADVVIPGSKSETNRLLFLAAAATGRTVLHRPLVADDTEACARALAALGYDIDITHAGRWAVTGRPEGPAAPEASIDTRDGATGARFLPGLVAAGRGVYHFTASEQMRRRPITPLLNALRTLGADIDRDTLPYTLRANGLAGGRLVVDAGVSSQYLTALLLAGPLTRTGLTLHVTRLVSAPYIDITLKLMRLFGASVERTDDVFRVEPGGYTSPGEVTVEPDASTASYFLAAAAASPGRSVTVPGLGTGSAQGDLGFARVLADMGAAVGLQPDSVTVTGPGRLTGVTADLHHLSDTMPTLAAIAPLATGPVRIENIANVRVKECDRLEACAAGLRTLGVPVVTGEDWIEIQPAQPNAALVATQRDHRIAMAFSVLGLRVPGLELDDPGCVIKTCPSFHQLLGDLTAQWEKEPVS